MCPVCWQLVGFSNTFQLALVSVVMTSDPENFQPVLCRAPFPRRSLSPRQTRLFGKSTVARVHGKPVPEKPAEIG